MGLKPGKNRDGLKEYCPDEKMGLASLELVVVEEDNGGEEAIFNGERLFND